MDRRQTIIDHLKYCGEATIPDLIKILGISENAVRYHLTRLKTEGFVKVDLKHDNVGRPAKHYALTNIAEGLFPKRYEELLDIVLEEAKDKGLLEQIIDGVVNRLVCQLSPNIEGNTLEAQLMSLMEQLDYGEMLGKLEVTEGGWELSAYNCVYKNAGCKFEAVCDVLPKVATKVIGTPVERPSCQRDGQQACIFTVSKVMS